MHVYKKIRKKVMIIVAEMPRRLLNEEKTIFAQKAIKTIQIG